MDIQAAVIHEGGLPFSIETLSLGEPRADEVLVRMVAAGVCHSDLVIARQDAPTRLPIVLGHEGAGIVERVGSAVDHVAVGDHVVLSFPSCGKCASCAGGHPAYCSTGAELMMAGNRPDGTTSLTSKQGEIGSFFFGQSSFATHCVAYARNVVKVSRDAPLELIAPFGCGYITGAGTVLNVLRPKPGDDIAIFGCGGVGLAALMAAKIAGCRDIIAVDPVESRRHLAMELGAAQVLDPMHSDVSQTILDLGGVGLTVDTSGVRAVQEMAVRILRRRGVCALLGGGAGGTKIELDQRELLFGGFTVMGVVEGDSDPQTFIPYLVDQFLAGRFPVDKITRFYDFPDINRAVADSESGQTVKPVLRFSA
jgi:aryl-alcohol dehydrogenase